MGLHWASLMVQMIKNLPAMQETLFDPWFNPWFDPQEVKNIPWRQEWLPTPLFLPGEFHGQRKLTVHGVAKSQTLLSN